MKPRHSEWDEILPGISEEKFLREARKYIESAFPNPDRTGCPPREELETLARRKRSATGDEIEHIGTCSPCFVEYRAIRIARKRRRSILIWSGVAAAVATLVFSGILLFRPQDIPSPPPPVVPKVQDQVEIAQEVVEKQVINLRPYERVRGEGNSRAPAPLVLKRANLELTIQLPVGSEEGKYVFELLDSQGVRQVETSGEAAIKNYVTTAEARFDLRSLSPGRFTLAVRRVDAPRPFSYPVEVR